MTGRTILIADDEAYLTQILSFNIQKTGAKVIVARNGQESCALAEKHHPDLIVSDYQMPIMDGLAACIALKANPATAAIPVIMLTARGHKLSADELVKTNIRSLLAKPFSARDLITKIQEILASAAPSPDDKKDKTSSVVRSNEPGS
jgi:CheY-like chemotaxis protein